MIDRRMREAQAEISHANEFDYLIINDQFDKALTDLESIVRYQKLDRTDQKGRVNDLLAQLRENR